LWTDAISKAPNNARPPSVLAIELVWGKKSTHPNRYDMALKLLETSLKKHTPSKSYRSRILGNMASIHFYNKLNHEKAISLYEEALIISPKNQKIRMDLVNALIILKDFEYALQQIDILINQNYKNGIYYNLKGHILLWKKDYADALSYFHKAYKLTPGKITNKINILLNTSVALSLSGEHEKAELLLLKVIKHSPDNISCYFVLIENSIRAQHNSKTNKYIKKIFNQFDRKQIRHGLEKLTDNPKLAPISKKLIAPVIKEMLR